MMILLLTVIFIMFIGLGIPDSVLGVAWPSLYPDLGVTISFAGYITATVSALTVVSGLLSSKLINRLGNGVVASVSTLCTAIALLGYSFTEHPLFLFIFAIPLGLGAGAIDAALNGFVVLHYSASKLSYLHCFYGLGITMSPFVMSIVLDEGGWRNGYRIMAVVQLVIALIGFASLPLWKKVKVNTLEEVQQKTVPVKELLKKPDIWLNGSILFMSDALLMTTGAWCSSYFVEYKEFNPDKAASITMLYYIGLAVGRFLSGMFADKIGRRKVLRISLSILPVALIMFMLPVDLKISAIALFLIGMGIGPVYPNITHMTPEIFGEDIAQSVIGVGQAMCYTGITLMPWLFGLLAEKFSTALLPYYLSAMFIVYAVTFILLMRKLNNITNNCKD